MDKNRKLVCCKPVAVLITVSLLLSLLTGCSSKKHSSDNNSLSDPMLGGDTSSEIKALAKTAGGVSCWYAYWDCADGLQTVSKLSDFTVSSLIFAANFNEDGSLSFPDQSENMVRKIRASEEGKKADLCLTVVNDVLTGSGNSLKDTDILYKVLSADNAEDHADEIISMAVSYGFDGVEIDYERIRKDLTLWKLFTDFEEILIKKASDNGLYVRVVLETSTPVSEISFPEEAQHIVMCYNLYGWNGQPGPKADYEFLKNTALMFSSVPNISFALANGGYIWTGGKPSQISRANAEALIIEHKADALRDSGSGAIYFTYKSGLKENTVWFADEETLVSWSETLNEVCGKKVPVSLWRMNG